MNAHRLTGYASLLLGLGTALSALLGPLLLGVIDFRVSENAENQVIGGELVALVLVAPVAMVAGVLWLRGSPLAPILAIGPGLFAVYTYVTFVLGAEYERYPGNNERAFPLYAVLILLGWVTATRGWSAFDATRLPPLAGGLRRLLAGLLMTIGVMFALLWTASIVDVLHGSEPPTEYTEQPVLFWLIRLLDLAFIIPLSLATGVGLLRGAPWATKPAIALIGFQTLLLASVAGMSVAMTARDDPAANPVLLVVMVGSTLALAALYLRVLRVVSGRGGGGAMPRPAPAPR